MKYYLSVIAFVVGITAIAPFPSFAQQPLTSAKVKKSSFDLSNAVYNFRATDMYPMRGGSRNLTPDYNLIFSKDTLNGRLPYIGVATAVNFGTTNGGVNLRTGNFTYTQSINKKGTCIIRYKLKGSNDVTNITFNIYKDSTADVSFRFLQRDGISYRGNIEVIALP